jgi:hypothetical protein
VQLANYTLSATSMLVLLCCLQTIIPLGLRDRRQMSTGVPDYTPKTDRKLNTTIIFDPTVGVNGTELLSCPALQGDLPNGELLTSTLYSPRSKMHKSKQCHAVGLCKQSRVEARMVSK